MTLSIGYVWASLDARAADAGRAVRRRSASRRGRPGWSFPLFLFEAVRVVGRRGARCATREGLARAAAARCCASAPRSRSSAASCCWHNYARFENPFEFGHKFLNVQWQERILRFGLFNYHFLSRNLAAALVLLPRILDALALRARSASTA